MSDNSVDNTCPRCGRVQPGQPNFCPYCGYSFRSEPKKPPTPPPAATEPEVETKRPPVADHKPPPTPPYEPGAAKHFRILDWRVLFGLLGLLDIPVIIVLLIVLIGPNILTPAQPSVCEQLDLAEFSPERFQRGIGGELTENTFFAADTEYVIQDTLVVPHGRSLLIQSGARLVFEKEAALDVYGDLFVCGTSREPVTFTSEEGEPGSWPGIRLREANSQSVLNHVLIQFAGDRALYLEGATPTLVDVKIANSSGFPISTDGNALPDLDAEIDIDDNPFRGIEIRSGTLTEEYVEWPDQDLVYVVSGPLEVGSNTTLVVMPDSIVKFWHAPRSDPPGLVVRGLLKADKVQFTSVYDSRDEMGGVTYREARDPAPGDWAGIGFYESSDKSYLHGCVIQYAGQRGGRSTTGSVSMVASSPELTEVTIADGIWYPLSADADSFPVLEDVRLVSNDPGDALEIRGGTAVTGRNKYVWGPIGGEPQIVRVIRGEVVVEPDATLIIEPGAVIKFEENGKLTVRGTLNAVGGENDSERIVFTSLRDGDYGGDTDKATSPQDKRTWGGIVFESTDESSVLQNCIVGYAAITLNDAGPRLIENLFTESESAPIWASPGASPELRGNRLEDNGVNGLAIWKAELRDDQVWSRLGEGDDQLVRVLAGEVMVAEGAVLSIEPGVIVKGGAADAKLTIRGGLRVMGQEDNPVVFTSLNDDSVGGDTNSKLAGADAGDWPGIEVAADASVLFSHTVIRYAQNGLFLRGTNAPVIEGWLRVTEGKNALQCEGELRMPSTFRAEGNEVNEVVCTTE